MINFQQYSQIKYYHEDQGLKFSQISDKLGLDNRTIKRWLETDNYHSRRNPVRQSKLDPFKTQIQAMIEKYPYTTVQILQKIKEQGYSGGKTILNDYIFKIRPPKTKAYLTLSFAPGECAQVDWGHFGTVNAGNIKRRLYFFVMVLCYSRMIYVEFTLSQAMEFFLGCHQNAFEYFGGVPEKIMIDNLKTGVLRHRFGELPVFNPLYLDFANHYGFKIKACNAGKGNEKGSAENAVRYVKQNCLHGLEISDFKILNPLAKKWMDETANERIHRITNKKPKELFEAEKPHLKPLNINLFDIGQSQIIRVSTQFRITFETNRYSVPYKLASTLLTMKRYPDKLCIYKNDEYITEHIRCFEKYRDFENPDHVVGLLKQRKKAKDQKVFLRFLNLSPKAQIYYQHLEEKRLNPKVHIRKIVALSEIYGQEKMKRAIEDAIELCAFSSEYIENLLEQRERANFLEEPETLHLTRREDLLELELPEPDLNLYQNDDQGEYNVI